MQHVAIDLGGKESQICIRTADGTILEERKHPTQRLGRLMQQWPPSRVVLETSAEAFRVADAARECGHEIRVVPATLVRSLGVGSRGVKNDQKDARVLSEVSCRIDLPSVHIPSELSRRLKSLSGSRELLIATRTRLINNIRGWMRTQLVRVRSGATMSFVARVRAHVGASGIEVPTHIERELALIEMVNAQLKEADRELLAIAKEHPICLRLMTVPGVGPVTAVRFVAAVDVIERFASAHHLQSYLGLTPGENSSSERQQRTGITKAGPREVRRALVQAAWVVMLNCRREPMAEWAERLAARRGKFVAVVGLARKLAGILFAIWRDATTYNAMKAVATR